MQISDKAKECLLQLLDKFVSVCKEYGLQYYLAGGSVLGAVRHKGFIPWDDDIDVYLMRTDYEKLLKLPESIWGDNFRLAFYSNTPNYTYDFIKIELTNTSVIERIHPNYHGGVFLDVFPLDWVPNDPIASQKKISNIKRIGKKYIEAFIKNDSDCTSVFELLKLWLNRYLNRNHKIFDRWENLAVEKDTNNLTHVANFHFLWNNGPIPFEWLAEGTKLEFEGKQYIVPLKYDLYLKHIYGDYMCLPPLESRVGHAFDYIDYERRLSADECEKVFRSLHSKYSYKFVLKREIKNVLRFLHIIK